MPQTNAWGRDFCRKVRALQSGRDPNGGRSTPGSTENAVEVHSLSKDNTKLIVLDIKFCDYQEHLFAHYILVFKWILTEVKWQQQRFGGVVLALLQ